MKQAIREEIGTHYDSRSILFANRIRELKESPFWGVGFSSIKYGHVRDSGTIEPGSSWLAILSMTGIIGFSIFMRIIVDCIKGMGSNNGIKQKNALLIGVFVFFVCHMFFEGYVFAANSTFFFILWTLIGVSIDGLYQDNAQINYFRYLDGDDSSFSRGLDQ